VITQHRCCADRSALSFAVIAVEVAGLYVAAVVAHSVVKPLFAAAIEVSAQLAVLIVAGAALASSVADTVILEGEWAAR
jgi:hypothetical protein